VSAIAETPSAGGMAAKAMLGGQKEHVS